MTLKRKAQGYKPPVSMAQQLRTVGQGLESMDVEDFDLQEDGDGYFVFGVPRDAGKTNKKTALQNAWNNLSGRHPAEGKLAESASRVLRILFTPEGLLRLEVEGRAKRNKNSAGVPNLTKLAQVLRMIGERLDTQAGRLLKVSKRQDWVSFEYVVDSGKNIKERWKLSDLYKLWLDASSQREERADIMDREIAQRAKLDESL